jgi:hypothetical protein
MLGAIGTVIVIAALIYVAYRRHMSTFENIGSSEVYRYLQMLLERGANGAFMIFEEKSAIRFVQFKKFADHSGVRLETHFPRAPWSEPYYAGVQAVLDERKVPFDEVTGSGRPVFLFVRAAFGTDVEAAAHFVEDVFTKVFGFETVRVRVRSDGIDAASHHAASQPSGENAS